MSSTGTAKRTRGPNKSTPWVRRPEDGLAVLRLALDTTDPVQASRVEAMFSAAFSMRRALQRDARDRALAYWAAPHERARDATAVRERVGLSKEALEYAAYAHRRPVRVNCALRPRWMVRRGQGAYTRPRRGGSANRWHGVVSNPG